ncbi:30S ribosomal protein S6 [Chryseobacterium taklimakanense]|uniref:GYDIA family GHMP kinase n=1 Tax=Chryseobacterium taklimakanense TaxID=536441 RepID=UPI000F5F5B57|nr:GYDIA family GHMP kinase [Chryseobacterium taklimakanense]AZI21950.1 30S ribosomal protein S6 [Chryseobacterium taklimakanense]
MGKIFSPGKLLLTSEYVVLDGALALAVPTQLGQEFFFEETEDGKSLIRWEAYHQNQVWLKTEIDYKNGCILHTNLKEPAEFILKVLMKVAELSEIKFKNGVSYRLKTNLQFPSNFGLGSSSTLMNNLAEWAGTDAYLLSDSTLGGSGYDIAVAKEKNALLFQIKDQTRISNPVSFNPEFSKDLIFIHLNQKQDSREGISLYRSKTKSPTLIDEFSEITEKVLVARNIEEFSFLMVEHERKLSEFLGLQTVKEKFFADCPSFVKSLGAWGGDFVMASRFSGFRDYFLGKGFGTVFSYAELID